MTGADDFLPVLIYVVIHANPPQLASNLEYIQRFRMHSRMVSESAYFFTQLVSTQHSLIAKQNFAKNCLSMAKTHEWTWLGLVKQVLCVPPIVLLLPILHLTVPFAVPAVLSGVLHRDHQQQLLDHGL